MAQKPSDNVWTSGQMVGGFGDRLERGAPTDRERLDLATETLRGARWLLLLGLQAIEGAPTLGEEAEEVKRGLALVDELCARLRRR